MRYVTHSVAWTGFEQLVLTGGFTVLRALIAYGFWWTHFGGDAQAVGRQVRLSVKTAGIIHWRATSRIPITVTLRVAFDMDLGNRESANQSRCSSLERTLGRLDTGCNAANRTVQKRLVTSTEKGW